MGWYDYDDAIYKSMHESMHENGASKKIRPVGNTETTTFSITSSMNTLNT